MMDIQLGSMVITTNSLDRDIIYGQSHSEKHAKLPNFVIFDKNFKQFLRKCPKAKFQFQKIYQKILVLFVSDAKKYNKLYNSFIKIKYDVILFLLL